MAYPNLKDADALKTWILVELGAPVVKVELAQEHLDNAVDNAIRWFSAGKGVRKQGFLALVAGQTVYPVPDDVDTILDVSFPANPYDLTAAFAPWLLPEQQIPWSASGSHGSSMGIYSNWVQALQYIEMAKRVMSSEEDWRQEGRLLYIFGMKTTSAGSKLIIDYKSGDFSIDTLAERDHIMLKQYALARAMLILGRIRLKYDGYPTAQGSVTLDAAALIEEAQAMIEKLTEDLAASGYPMGFICG